MHQAVQQGIAKSQNALIMQAVEEYLAQPFDRLRTPLEQDWIDAQFAEGEKTMQEIDRALNITLDLR